MSGMQLCTPGSLSILICVIVFLAASAGESPCRLEVDINESCMQEMTVSLLQSSLDMQKPFNHARSGPTDKAHQSVTSLDTWFDDEVSKFGSNFLEEQSTFDASFHNETASLTPSASERQQIVDPAVFYEALASEPDVRGEQPASDAVMNGEAMALAPDPDEMQSALYTAAEADSLLTIHTDEPAPLAREYDPESPGPTSVPTSEDQSAAATDVSEAQTSSSDDREDHAPAAAGASALRKVERGTDDKHGSDTDSDAAALAREKLVGRKQLQAWDLDHPDSKLWTIAVDDEVWSAPAAEYDTVGV